MRLVDWTRDYFARAGLEKPRLEAEVLLCHVLGMTRIELYTKHEKVPSKEDLARFKELIRRRLAGEPTQYLTHRAEFYGIEVFVDDRVLIPRSETELLVDRALEAAGDRNAPMKVADLCTGSACVALALAKTLPRAEIYAVDLSADALEIARRNIHENNMTDRIRVFRGDLTAPLEEAGLSGAMHVVVSNPPYVRTDEVDGLPVEVRAHEPLSALVAGPDGTEFHERIAGDCRRLLAASGALVLEIGCDQGPRVKEIMDNAGYHDVKVTRDYAGHERVVSAVK